jgi:hypothetical protein
VIPLLYLVSQREFMTLKSVSERGISAQAGCDLVDGIEQDNIEYLTALLAKRKRARGTFPDLYYMQLWKRVCDCQSSMHPLKVLAANFMGLSRYEDAQMYFLTSPAQKLKPTREILRALFPIEEERAFLFSCLYNARECWT